MTPTSVNVSFGLFALEINQDSSLECPDLQTFADLDGLRTGNVTRRPYITYEPDFWLLNGAYKSKPTTNPRVGLYSLSQSNGAGVFAVPPVLTITFSQVHSTEGLTLRFYQGSGDYADDIDIAFYDVSDTLIQTDNYNPTSWEFTTSQPIADFKKIIITFNSTNNPIRYLRVTGIDYGELIHITAADIETAHVVEELHPLSIELPINTFELELFTEDANFNIINPAGDYESLQDRQPLDVYEVVNGGVQIYMGQYFLDDWENPSEKEVRFQCVDLLGVLDGLTFFGGMWIDAAPLTTITAGDLLSFLLDPIGIPYELAPSLESIVVEGWLPISSYREALQQIAFAIGAYITTARTNVVAILPRVLASEITSPDFVIPKSEIAMAQTIALKKRVTGVELTSHDFVVADTFTTIELFNATLAVGTYKISFTQPVNAISETGGAVGGVTQLFPNYASVQITGAGTYVLNAIGGFTDMTVLHVEENLDIGSSKPNVLEIKDATLVSATVGVSLVQDVFTYYQQRYRQDVKLFASEIEAGRSVRLATLFDQTILGVAEKLEIDLTGGFVSKVQITGVVEE